MKTTFKYYGREYELEYDKEKKSGTITWVDGIYHSFLSFYEMNDHILFKAKGKMANSVNKKMSTRKKEALKNNIKNIIK